MPGRLATRRTAAKAVIALTKHALLSLAALTAISACATQPTGPRVLVLPGNSKSFEQFRDDDVSCRQYALSQAGRGASRDAADAQGRYDVAYVQCMYASGHRVPVPGGMVVQPDHPASSGSPPPSAAPSPGAPKQPAS